MVNVLSILNLPRVWWCNVSSVVDEYFKLVLIVVWWTPPIVDECFDSATVILFSFDVIMCLYFLTVLPKSLINTPNIGHGQNLLFCCILKKVTRCNYAVSIQLMKVGKKGLHLLLIFV